jgi:hypothetical protein
MVIHNDRSKDFQALVMAAEAQGINQHLDVWLAGEYWNPGHGSGSDEEM